MQKSKMAFTKKLTESAVMLALTLILSYFKLLDLPYGGSITLCSMLPTIFIAYRHGMLWGFSVGLANGILQLLMGLNTLSYATSAVAAVAIVFLDYIIAFSVSGFSGVFKKVFKNQTTSLVMGAALVCALRYLCHVISGCTVWAGLSIPDSKALIYSVAYNATYMLPELIIAVVGAAYLSKSIDFKAENLARITNEDMPKSAIWLNRIGYLGGTAAFIFDVILFARNLQNPNTGDFDITGLANTNFTAVIVATVIGLIWTATFLFIAKNKGKTEN